MDVEVAPANALHQDGVYRRQKLLTSNGHAQQQGTPNSRANRFAVTRSSLCGPAPQSEADGDEIRGILGRENRDPVSRGGNSHRKTPGLCRASRLTYCITR